MADALMITIPAAGSSAEGIGEALSALPAVESAEPSRTRSFDPASVMLLVQLGGSVLGVVGTAVPIIKQIVDTIRGKGVRGAVIEFPGGGKLSVDQASVSDIERLIRAARV